MKGFLDSNFLLHTKTAEYLYHQHAAGMPIIDYHCHLSPKQIAENKNFDNLTQPWLYGDHYKWRAMRSNGIDERYCSGNATDWEKYEKWAETVPFTMRNPLYHWTHLELQRYFGITDLLSPKTAATIYEKASDMLGQKDFSPVGLIKRMNVEIVCTTDDPVDSLEYHRKIKETTAGIRVIPAWRPDKVLMADNPVGFNEYIGKLAVVSGIDITSYGHLLEALDKRHEFFHDSGCRLSDHGLESFYCDGYTLTEINAIFGRIRKGFDLAPAEVSKFRSAMLYDLAVMDCDRGWTQQFHIGAMRNNNSRMFITYGPDGGFDSIGDYGVAIPASRFLDRLDKEAKLAKTILYNLNPADNEVMATMIGNFQDGTVPGKIQWGSGWWFLDQKDGMEKQLNALSNLGLLSRFVGMLTDSRSLLSYPRHEYFRRVLCNLIGNDVENGELPDDKTWLGKIVEDVCYHNARNYFNF
ncbi:MAG: glucuronate isomerase [Bacteroidales bacterium]|nr:glucuronate isomerase [Bacteroidales bacterium]